MHKITQSLHKAMQETLHLTMSRRASIYSCFNNDYQSIHFLYLNAGIHSGCVQLKRCFNHTSWVDKTKGAHGPAEVSIILCYIVLTATSLPRVLVPLIGSVFLVFSPLNCQQCWVTSSSLILNTLLSFKIHHLIFSTLLLVQDF